MTLKKYDLKFVEDSHLYYVDGIIKPNTTRIISNVFPFLHGESLASERAKMFGSAVHKAIELDLNKKLDSSTVDTAIMPYVTQFFRFMVNWDIYRTQCKAEVMLYSPKYGFAGRIDLVEKLVIEIKTGAQSPTHRLQVAASRHLWNINNPKNKITQKGIIVYLDGSDRPPKISRERHSDLTTFLACLEIYNFSKLNNMG